MSARRTIYLILGSNLHQPLRQLAKAKRLIEARLAKIINASAIFITEPWGMKDQPEFYNQVIKLKSSRNPHVVLQIIKGIEHAMGRTRSRHWGPRIIDIDILFFGKAKVYTKILTIPHPKIIERRFVLAPLVNLAPDLIHPALGMSMRTLLALCTDTSIVKKK